MKVIVRNNDLLRLILPERPAMDNPDVLNVQQLRNRQEQRVAQSLESWKQAKEHLEEAIRLAESREQEYHAVSEDVRRKLSALDVVVAMAGDREPAPESRQLSAPQALPLLPAPESIKAEPKAEPKTNVTTDLQRLDGVLGTSSRPLFSRRQRAGFAGLSILQ